MQPYLRIQLIYRGRREGAVNKGKHSMYSQASLYNCISLLPRSTEVPFFANSNNGRPCPFCCALSMNKVNKPQCPFAVHMPSHVGKYTRHLHHSMQVSHAISTLFQVVTHYCSAWCAFLFHSMLHPLVMSCVARTTSSYPYPYRS